MSGNPFVNNGVECVPGTSDTGGKRGADETDGPLAKIPRLFEPSIPKLALYGTFYIIGYNGFIPPRNRGRVRNYCHLVEKDYANGVKFLRAYNANTPAAMRAAKLSRFHNVIYKFSVNQSVVVEYQRDDSTDMFQVGRSAEPPIDFVVMDLDFHRTKVTSSVSRYACRVLVDRNNHKNIRIFAAGFDESANIFLGEKAIKWHEGRDVDALTTNGILIQHLQGDYWGGNAKPGSWHELSVCGRLYTLRPGSRDSNSRGVHVKEENNILKDGSLIDLCGATLLWRSAEGLQKSISKKELHNSLFKCVLECKERNENKYVVPLVNADSMATTGPHVHLCCGHIQSTWDPKIIPKFSRCPVGCQVGPAAPLCVGTESAFYVDDGPLLYAFNPCGHITNKKTVMYWSSIKLPTKNTFEAKCPFCATTLAEPVGYVRLRTID